jgi:UDP-glucose 4-epimerase
MKAFVTGGAGFIGSNLVEQLLKKEDSVTVYDNFSTGKKEFLKPLLKYKKLRIIKGDVLNSSLLEKSIKGHSIIFHLSANADVRKGTLNTRLDLEQETIATFNVLEAMRKNNIKKLVFPSSMTVYGTSKTPVEESFGPYLPISLYAAGKLSCEAFISAYANMFGIQSWILRYANIIGKHSTHGVVYDLVNRLLENNKKLHVLGDGYQTKSYAYVDDAVEAIFFLLKNSKEKVNIFNVAGSDTISVRDIVSIILKTMDISDTKVIYQKKTYGWIGDVPTFMLNANKIKKMGFKLSYSVQEAIKKTVEDILNEKKNEQ